MNPRLKIAADRIRQEVPILQVLANYGYRVRDDGGYREQQFSCDLHGTGRDNKPSARVYPESNSYYCFACDATRDPISLVMAKEGLRFVGAIRFLERAFGLDPLPIDTGYEDTPDPLDATKVLDATKTFDEEVESLRRYLDNRTRERELPLQLLLFYWDRFDATVFNVKGPKGKGGGPWSDEQGRKALRGIMLKCQDALKDLRESTAVHTPDPALR